VLLRSGAGSRYRPIAAAAARHAGRVNVGPTARRSNELVAFLGTWQTVTRAWAKSTSPTVSCSKKTGSGLSTSSTRSVRLSAALFVEIAEPPTRTHVLSI